MQNLKLKEFIIEKLFEKYNTRNYLNSGKGFTLFLKNLKYKDKLILEYITHDLNESNPFEFLYLLLNNITPSTCKICGNKTRFLNIKIGYNKYCSAKCSNNDTEVKEKKKKSYLNKYGVESPLQSNLIREKVRQTCLEKYEVENPLQNNLIKEKVKQTCLEKYGVSNPSQNIQIKEKKKNTSLKNYNVNYPLQSNLIKEKIKQTCLNKYGVENISQVEKIKEKKKNTFSKKYDAPHPLNLQEFKDESKNSCLKKYGVEHPFQNKQIQEKYKQTCLEKYGFEHPFQNKKVQEKYKQTYRRNFYNKLINSDRLKELIKPNFSLEEYLNVKKKYYFTCLKCNNIFKSTLNNGLIPRCHICFPKKNIYTSKYEDEIYNFLKDSLNENEIINRNNHTILENNLELDIYIPNRNLAIEFNGLYWHSERNGKQLDYHLNKTIQCSNKGIHLLHIFEDEWIEKQDIVKSILLNKMNKTLNRIFARKCKVRQIDNKLAFNFLDSNHLQGYIHGIHFGLFYNDKLVSCLTMGKSRFNKNFEYEILRFCSKNYHNVIGSFGKLFSHFTNKYVVNSIITYCDLRYGLGKVYLKNNFEYIGNSKPNYYYLDKNFNRLSRMGFQKHLLENKIPKYDPNLTEWENMQLNNYDRIWDCGNSIYVWRKELL